MKFFRNDRVYECEGILDIGDNEAEIPEFLNHRLRVDLMLDPCQREVF